VDAIRPDRTSILVNGPCILRHDTVERPAHGGRVTGAVTPTLTTLRTRLVLAGCIAAIAGFYSWWLEQRQPTAIRDISDAVYAAQAFTAGFDPYEVVGRSERWAMPAPSLYPFTAIVLFIPFAWIPGIWLHTAWVALGSGLLFWAVTRERLVTPTLMLFVSMPFLQAVQTTQWSPLLMAGALLPWGGWLLVCKPTTAIWLFAYRPTWRGAGLAMILVVVSIVIWPAWPWSWLPNLADAPNSISPLTLPGGVLVLLALLKWRRPETRLLAAMACVPHTLLPYETLPLFLVPHTWAEASVLLAGTTLAVILHAVGGPYDSPTAWVSASGVRSIWCVYLPCVVMILRRPNVGDTPLIDALLQRRRTIATDGAAH
jgi:hypothetical protein